MRQLLAHAAAVAPQVGVAPGDDRAVLPQSGESAAARLDTPDAGQLLLTCKERKGELLEPKDQNGGVTSLLLGGKFEGAGALLEGTLSSCVLGPKETSWIASY